jgi:hypothetical protein
MRCATFWAIFYIIWSPCPKAIDYKFLWWVTKITNKYSILPPQAVKKYADSRLSK